MERVNSVGAVAQMVERLLSMQEAGGSMPPSSTFQIPKKHKTKKKDVAGKFRLGNEKRSDSGGVRTHALSDCGLKTIEMESALLV